jgi:hypothetical protein
MGDPPKNVNYEKWRLSFLNWESSKNPSNYVIQTEPFPLHPLRRCLPPLAGLFHCLLHGVEATSAWHIADRYGWVLIIWVRVKIGYPLIGWLIHVNTKHILKSVVPQGSNFDSYPSSCVSAPQKAKRILVDSGSVMDFHPKDIPGHWKVHQWHQLFWWNVGGVWSWQCDQNDWADGSMMVRCLPIPTSRSIVTTSHKSAVFKTIQNLLVDYCTWLYLPIDYTNWRFSSSMRNSCFSPSSHEMMPQAWSHKAQYVATWCNGCHVLSARPLQWCHLLIQGIIRVLPGTQLLTHSLSSA